MECARLGHSGIEVSSLCLGGMSFGVASPRFHQWTIGPQETRAGKSPALGASEAYAYQLHNLQDVAEREGFTKVTSMQCHYNLLYCEDEREMIPVCRQFGMALMPYSPMASGHLCRPTWDTDSKRSETDSTMVNKYGGAREEDLPIIACAAEVAARHEVPMARAALAWHWARASSRPSWAAPSPSASTTPWRPWTLRSRPMSSTISRNPIAPTSSWGQSRARARSRSRAPRR